MQFTNVLVQQDWKIPISPFISSELLTIRYEQAYLFLLYITCFVFYNKSLIKTMITISDITQIENIGQQNITSTQPLSPPVYLHGLPTPMADFASGLQTITI